jgi:hypothetical protein
MIQLVVLSRTTDAGSGSCSRKLLGNRVCAIANPVSKDACATNVRLDAVKEVHRLPQVPQPLRFFTAGFSGNSA